MSPRGPGIHISSKAIPREKGRTVLFKAVPPWFYTEWSAYFSMRGCVNPAFGTLVNRVRFTQPHTEKYVLTCRDLLINVKQMTEFEELLLDLMGNKYVKKWLCRIEPSGWLQMSCCFLTTKRTIYYPPQSAGAVVPFKRASQFGH